MDNEDYRNDFPEEAVISIFIKRDPETNEVLGPATRQLTKRELLIKAQIKEVKICVDTIFLEKKDNSTLLDDIEQDLVALLAKLKRYAEEAS